jgi:hypothetical protein
MVGRELRLNVRLLPPLLFAGAAVNFLFWTLYFLGIIELTEDGNQLVQAFETAFPYGDALLGISLVAAGVGIMREEFYGRFFLTVSAAMALYLGILDVSFYASNGFYLPLSSGKVILICINTICVAGGSFGLFASWRQWRLQ